MINLSKKEADLLLPIGQTMFDGTEKEFKALVTNAYWVIDDSPFPYPVRQRQMATLERLASRHGFTIDLF